MAAKFPLLAGMPDIGRSRDDLEPGLRTFSVQSHIIYYRKATSGGILISRIIHGMRDQEKALRKLGKESG